MIFVFLISLRTLSSAIKPDGPFSHLQSQLSISILLFQAIAQHLIRVDFCVCKILIII